MKLLKLFLLGICLFSVGCTSTDRVTLPVQEPARVILPSHMKRIGVINRAVSDEKAGILETVDQVLSVKSPQLDRLGAEAGFDGLVEELSNNERVEALKMLPSETLDDPAYGVFPAPLRWHMVEKICAEHDLDGLFSLEWFDTDTKIDYETREVTRKGPGDVEIPMLEHLAAVRTTIKTGWRIYDNTGKAILDEYQLTESIVTSGRGINPVKALEAVTGRREAVQTIGGDLGRRYGRSVAPYWTRVSRKYYVKGNENFIIAKRRAQTGNWEGAGELWLAETENSEPEIAGRAHYNMAIMNEIEGRIDESIAWARTAYEDYGNKLALYYLRALQDRKESMALLHAER